MHRRPQGHAYLEEGGKQVEDERRVREQLDRPGLVLPRSPGVPRELRHAGSGCQLDHPGDDVAAWHRGQQSTRVVASQQGGQLLMLPNSLRASKAGVIS